MGEVVNLDARRERYRQTATGLPPEPARAAAERRRLAAAPGPGLAAGCLNDLTDRNLRLVHRLIMLGVLSEEVRRAGSHRALHERRAVEDERHHCDEESIFEGEATMHDLPYDHADSGSDLEWIVRDEPSQQGSSPAEIAVQPGWVLLVEDDIDARDELVEALTRQGFLVWLADSAHGALESLDSGEHFSTIIMDARLRDGSAHPLIAALARRPLCEERIVLISGLSDPRLGIPEALVERTVFLEKPLRLDELLAALLPVSHAPDGGIASGVEGILRSTGDSRP